MTDQTLPDRGSKLIPVQVLRGLAAASVLFGHVQVEVSQKSVGFTPIAFDWGMGVDVFFVISGLIMVISSQRMFGAPQGPSDFITRRLIRIVPIYWFYTTLAIVALLIVPSSIETMRWDPLNAVSSYLFLPAYRWDGKIAPLLSLGWTLNYEMFFYLMFAGTLWLRPRAATLVLLGLLTVLATLGALVDFGPAPLVFWTRSIILEFGFGVVLGWLWLRTGRRQSAWLLVFALAAAVATHMGFSALGAPRVLMRGVPAALIVAGFVWGFSDAIAAKMKPIADWLGESSYSLYLSHPFSVGLSVMLWPLARGQFDWLMVAAATTAGLAGGIVSHRAIERPLLSWMQGWLKPRGPTPRLPRVA